MNACDVKVSLIVPVFNVAEFLRESLDSFLGQTLSEIEIICVNDGSTDDSSLILAEYAKRDVRIKVLEQKNCGTVIARNRAVACSRGAYVMFVDPDDKLKPMACERVYHEAVRLNADILQYGVEFLEMFKRTEAQRRTSELYFNSAPESCLGSDILPLVYRDTALPWSLIFHAFRGDLARAAFAEIPDIRSINETDAFAFFYIAVRAKSFFCITDRLYVYRYGTGVSTKKTYGLSEYKRTLGKIPCAYALQEYAQKIAHQHPEALSCARIAALRMISNSWASAFSRMGEEKRQLSAVRALIERVQRRDLVSAWAFKYEKTFETFMAQLERLNVVPRRIRRKVRHVGFYYHRMSHGGVQRVISLLLPIFQRLGVKATLFLDEDPAGSAYPVPDGVVVVKLPSPLGGTSAWQRVDALFKALEDHPVDLFYSHAHVSPMAFWDMLVCKFALKMPYVVHQHSVFTCLINGNECSSYKRFFEIPFYHRMCDFVITLSRVDSSYERMNGASAIYLPNPVSDELRQVIDSPMKRKLSHHILWLARLSWEKHPGDALQIFRRVRDAIPDATMSMVGGGDPKIEDYLRKIVSELGLENVINIVGATNDVVAEYGKASVYLSTSGLEGFPMTSLEALSCGVPIVAYELRYLELYRDNEAVVQVKQGDVVAAASAIVKLLSSPPDGRSDMARQVVRRLSDYDHESAWRNLLDAIENGKDIVDCGDPASDALMLATFRGGFHNLLTKMMAGEREAKKKTDCIRQELSSSNKRRAELWHALEAAKASQAKAWKVNAVLEGELKAAREKLQARWSELGAAKASQAKAWEKNNALEGELKAAREKLQARWTELEASKASQAKAWKVNAALEGELKAARESLQARWSELEAAKANQEKAWKVNAALEGELKAAREKLQARWSELEASKASQAKAWEKNNALEGELKASREKLQARWSELEAAKASQAKAWKVNAALEGELKAAREKLQARWSELEVSKASQEKAWKANSALKKTVAELKAMLAWAEQETEREKYNATAKAKEIADLKSSLAYRIGMYVTMPVRAIKRLLSRCK